jgi:hypothetical protein
MAKLYGQDRLIPTELNTLIGLMVKGPLDLTELSPDKLQCDRVMIRLSRSSHSDRSRSTAAERHRGPASPADRWRPSVGQAFRLAQRLPIEHALQVACAIS